MTFREWKAARQLLMEEMLGVHLRKRAYEEDATFKKTKARVSR